MQRPLTLLSSHTRSSGCARRPRCTPLLLLIGLALAATPALPAQMLSAQTAAASPSTRAIRVQIETDRATYCAGDSILVRLTLVNTGAVPLDLTRVPPWRAARLMMTDANGQPVAPARLIDGRFFRSGRSFIMEPGSSFVESYDHEVWTALRSFGYGPLTPGQYTLTAVPLVSGPGVDVDAETVRSNQVPITITP